MMPVTLSILSGVLLIIFLSRLWKTTCVPEVELSCASEGDDDERASCPREFVATVFCPDDWEFVSKFNSEPLKALFLQERKSVARAWVRATARSIQRIMREHVLITRRSNDLQIGTEVTIYLRYLVLQVSCVALIVSIQLIGPSRSRLLSLYVYRLSERLSYAHSALKTATESGLRHS